MSSAAAPFEIAGQTVAPGATARVDVPISVLSNGLAMTLPVKVVHGARPGPALFVSAAVHGDEVAGVEIVRRLANRPALAHLSGTLLLIPVVNGYGFLNRSRYLPDRRDLNRAFPGHGDGSLAARLADVFLTEIVARCDYGVDLHSAAVHRANLPQIRVAPGDARLFELARVFGAPAILTSSLRDGSLRLAAKERGVPVLLFEGGEGLRFDETATRAGLAGCLRVMAHIGMIEDAPIDPPAAAPVISDKSDWLRAPEGGLLRLTKDLGAGLEAGEPVGAVGDLFGEHEVDIVAEHAGVLVGRATLPVVNEGDAVAHVARPKDTADLAGRIETIVAHLAQAEMFYEDEII